MKKLFLACVICLCAARGWAADRPNIVWIVAEDMSPDLGCYGDPQAHTPNMDKLARAGARFTRAFTHAPVCAPSRSGLITGMYPTTIGTHHMRSELIAPPEVFTAYLRKAGYYVDWPGKTDFNFAVPANAFDSTADWTKQIPKQPFFAYINLFESHESQIRLPKEQFAKVTARLKPDERHDPAKATLPPYYPDTPEVRRDWANYYDLITAVDYRLGDVLAVLERAGVADNTVVFFFGDHGRGLTRGKRWVYDSGLRVPLIIRWPGKIPGGSVREDLVSFVDFAPTVLALAGVEIPARWQGQPFLGPNVKERKYIFAARDRMDETYDRMRAVRTKQYKYIRNFHPELPYAQKIAYMELMPTMQAWRRLNAEGKLTGPAKLFFAPTKPKEELYDVTADPHEINNLVGSPKYQDVLKELRAVLDKWIVETKDMGAIPEEELVKRGLVKDVLSKYAERRQNGIKQ
jgi:uncharacterized sulfatase